MGENPTAKQGVVPANAAARVEEPGSRPPDCEEAFAAGPSWEQVSAVVPGGSGSAMVAGPVYDSIGELSSVEYGNGVKSMVGSRDAQVTFAIAVGLVIGQAALFLKSSRKAKRFGWSHAEKGT
jgi:hypothetical protein